MNTYICNKYDHDIRLKIFDKSSWVLNTCQYVFILNLHFSYYVFIRNGKNLNYVFIRNEEKSDYVFLRNEENCVTYLYIMTNL
jgi:hypothetical protein